MKDPYYTNKFWKIYLDDSFEILSQFKSIDLLLTDPPYGAKTNFKREGRGARILKGTKLEDRDWPELIGDDKPFNPTIFLEYPEVILWGANHYCNFLPGSSKWLIWDKRDGRISDDNADCEIAWTNLKGPARIHRQLWRGICRAGEENISISGKKLHQAQKPVALMTFCINQSKTKGLIIDPFMGSGTTLVAATRLGRFSIGIDISEECCEITAKRLEREIEREKQ